MGCCGRKFSKERKPSIPEKRKNLNIRRKWKNLVHRVNQQRRRRLIHERISGKTYSTYAIQHKFRKRYVSLKIGVDGHKKPEKKRKEIHVDLACKLPKKEQLPQRRASTQKSRINLKDVVLRVAASIDMDDFEPSEEEEEEEEEEEIEGEIVLKKVRNFVNLSILSTL